MKLTVAVEAGTQQIRAMLVDPDDIRQGLPWVYSSAAEAVDVNALQEENTLVEAVVRVVSRAAGERCEEVKAVSIACSTAVDLYGRISVVRSETQDMAHFRRDLAPQLSTALGSEDLQVGVFNRSCMGAVGEWKYGRGREMHVDEMVYLSVGGLVGAGIISQDRLIMGKHGFAGQFGHMLVNPRSTRMCTKCHQTGCLSSLVGGEAILSDLEQCKDEDGAAELLKYLSAHPTPETKDAGDRREIDGLAVDARAVVDAAGNRAAAGHRLARDIMMKSVEPLSAAIGQMICLLDPAFVVLGGVLADASYLGEALDVETRKYVPPFRRTFIHIRRSGFADHAENFQALSGDESALYGAAAFIWDRALLRPV